MTKRVAADVMSRELVTLNEEDSLADILAGMERYELRHIPIVDGERLVGLLTHRDILRLSKSALTAGPADASVAQRAMETFVGTVMTRDPQTITSDTALDVAAARMVDGHFGCLPVVDDGALVGIITEHDLLAAFADNES